MTPINELLQVVEAQKSVGPAHQWLVAAMGIGWGFGLQEIFANFISGIILLFERPIRVGDIITLASQRWQRSVSLTVV